MTYACQYACHFDTDSVHDILKERHIPPPHDIIAACAIYCLQVAFAMCKFHRLELQIIGLLKKLVMQSYDADAQNESCTWLSALPAGTASPLKLSGSCLEAALLKAVRQVHFDVIRHVLHVTTVNGSFGCDCRSLACLHVGLKCFMLMYKWSVPL